ncbi:MAG: DinB family protein, partial [Planctomycetota bacterium]
MPNRVPWTKRSFNFDFPADLYPELIERLRGTPARAEEITRSLPADVLTRRDGDTWSIQENLGHL